jgi:protoporphyrinogen/coproporphyrinogen III oxidase
MRVCVIGGGISGLTAAYRLLREGVDVELLEGSARVGGLLGSEQVDGGYTVETGADSILTEKPWALRLAEEVGLSRDIIATRQSQRGAYIVRSGKLERVPEGFSLLAPTDLRALARSPLLSPLGKLRAATELVVPPRGADVEDESLEAFVVRRLGRQLFDRLAQPLAGGIYGADPKRLSLRATMPRFLDLEQKHGSVIRGLWAGARARAVDGASHDVQQAAGARYGLFAAFSGGMQTFVDALEKQLAGRVRTLRLVGSVEGDERGYRVEAQGSTTLYDAVVLALPSHVAARVLTGFDPALASELSRIEYASAATVTYAWPRTAIAHPLEAFGFVVPVIEKRGVIASTWASVKYEGRAPGDRALIRVFMGGHRGQHLVEYGDDELIALGRRELRDLIGVSAAPDFTRVVRYVRAMPQYHLGHLARVQRIEALAERHTRFALAGNAYRGVGIPDAVRSGEQAAARILQNARSSTLSASS